MNRFSRNRPRRTSCARAWRRRPAPRARARTASCGASTKSGAQCFSSRSAYWARLARFCDTGFLRELRQLLLGSTCWRMQCYVTRALCCCPPGFFFCCGCPCADSPASWRYAARREQRVRPRPFPPCCPEAFKSSAFWAARCSLARGLQRHRRPLARGL
jgi:hypothetical protein